MHFIACNYTSIKLFKMPFFYRAIYCSSEGYETQSSCETASETIKLKMVLKDRGSQFRFEKKTKNKILPYTISRNYLISLGGQFQHQKVE